MKIGDLFVALGIKADQEGLARFNAGINNLKRDIGLVTTAFIGATLAVDRFVDGTIKGTVNLQNFQNQTGIAIEKLQRLQQAGQLADLTLTPDAIAQSVNNLQKSIIDITKLGKGNFRPFQLLGIDPTSGDAFDIIDQIRDRIRGLDPAIATNLIQELGLSPQFINILRLTREEMEKMSENTFLSPRQRNLVLQAGTAMTKLKLTLKALKDQAVAKLAPILTQITEKFFLWVRDNGSKVSDALTSIATAMTSFVEAASTAVGFLSKLLEKFLGFDNGLKIIIAGLGLLAVALLPFSKWLLAISAIVLVLEDIAVFMRGGDSLIGFFVDKAISHFKRLKEVIGDKLLSIKNFVIDTATNIADSISQIFDAVIDAVVSKIKGSIEFINGFFIKIRDAFKEISAFMNKLPFRKKEEEDGIKKFPTFTLGALEEKTSRINAANANSTINNFSFTTDVNVENGEGFLDTLTNLPTQAMSQLNLGT